MQQIYTRFQYIPNFSAFIFIHILPNSYRLKFSITLRKKMKAILPIIALFISLAASAQQSSEIKQYTSSSGHTFTTGEMLHLGLGSGTNHEFVFIYTNPLSITGKISIGSAWAGSTMLIKSVKIVEGKKTGKKAYLVCGIGSISNYWCDIEAAIITGEVIIKEP